MPRRLRNTVSFVAAPHPPRRAVEVGTFASAHETTGASVAERGSEGEAMATALAAAPPVTRWPWIDKLRVAVIAGVVVFHTAAAYVVAIPWYYEERTTSAGVQDAFSVPMLLAAVFARRSKSRPSIAASSRR